MEQEVCKIKHETIDRILDNHEVRLDKLEVDSTTMTAQMKNVCDRLDKLIDVLYDIIKSTAGGAIILGVGFIVWYIQR